MVVSHKHKFIYVHLGRTSGRSISFALSRHCGADDIITPISKRLHRGQNFAGFKRHDKASDIRRKVGEKVWNEYFKFTFERNPWEKIISRYWAYAGLDTNKFYKRIWQNLFGQPLDFTNWFRMKVWQGRLLGLGHVRFPRHYGCYTDNGRVIVDFIGRQENRKRHLELLSDRLGIRIDPDIHIGSDIRKDRRPYIELYDHCMQQIVANIYSKDLELLDYRFGEPPPTEALEFSPGDDFGDSRSGAIKAAA
jgi:hypothetical protein